MIHIRQVAKYIVELGDLSPTDVEEGMRIGVERKKYKITLPLPPKIDPSVSLMTVEERPDVTYNDIGGYKEQLEQLREVLADYFHTSKSKVRISSGEKSHLKTVKIEG